MLLNLHIFGALFSSSGTVIVLSGASFSQLSNGVVSVIFFNCNCIRTLLSYLHVKDQYTSLKSYIMSGLA